MAKTEQEQQFNDAWDESTGSPASPGASAAPDADEGADDAGAPDLAIVIGAAPAEAVGAPGAAAEAAASGDTAAEEAHESPAVEAAEDKAAEAETPEETQQRKSWEGRLKKREEELAAQASDLEAQRAALPAAATGDVTEVVAALNADFGADFVSRLLTVIRAETGTATEAVAGKLRGELGGLQQAIQSALQAMHTSAILDVHPDLDDVVKSDGFKQWLDGKDAEKKASAEAVMQRGMWPQIIRLVQTYKDETKAASEEAPVIAAEASPEPAPVEEEPDPWADTPPSAPASAAVRLQPGTSAGAADDFDSAWDEATKR